VPRHDVAPVAQHRLVEAVAVDAEVQHLGSVAENARELFSPRRFERDLEDRT
jgi:hypothetical protein